MVRGRRWRHPFTGADTHSTGLLRHLFGHDRGLRSVFALVYGHHDVGNLNSVFNVELKHEHYQSDQNKQTYLNRYLIIDAVYKLCPREPLRDKNKEINIITLASKYLGKFILKRIDTFL